MRILAGGASDPGRVRTNNEDAFLIDVELGLVAVADGMGGEAAGEVASHLALETLHREVSEHLGEDPQEVLRDAIRAADRAVLDEARADPRKAKMGTTLTALLVGEDRATVGHVGDSRLYRVRWGEVEKLTHDHTAAMQLVEIGILSEEEAPKHPWAHILSRVVGREEELDVETATLDLEPGDRFLLCSDGFSDSLRDPRWLATFEASSPEESATELVARAVELDGKDNATAVVLVVGGPDEREPRTSKWKSFRELVRAAVKDLSPRDRRPDDVEIE